MSLSATDDELTPQLIDGAHVAGWRETSQTAVNGSVQPGILFTVQLASGNTTNVFVPYVLIKQTGAVASAINQQVAAIQAIEAL